MSHVVTVQTRLHDPAAVAAACQRLGLEAPVHGTARVYSEEATGLVVRLPGWEYPVVIDTLTGVVRYDNDDGYWGDPKQLQRLMQSYAVEKVKLEARKKGCVVTEQALEDGRVRLQLRESP